jgi:hypothetical protein
MTSEYKSGMLPFEITCLVCGVWFAFILYSEIHYIRNAKVFTYIFCKSKLYWSNEIAYLFWQILYCMFLFTKKAVWKYLLYSWGFLKINCHKNRMGHHTDLLLLLGTFAKLRKPTINFVMSVWLCVLSVCPHGTTQLQLDRFWWNLIFELFRKFCWK